MAKEIKIGVQSATGGKTDYLWDVWILDLAFQEAMKFLDEDQYGHVAAQVREMAREFDPSHSVTASVDAIEDFYELREKGGPLGKINVRVFFFLDKRVIGRKRNHAIVILGAIKKENQGQTPKGDKIRIGRRLRKYLAGDYGGLPA